MILRTLELACLSLFGGCSLLASLAASPEPTLLRFGALGLVAFMVMQNDRQRRELTKANNSLSQALMQIAQALKDRPCMVGDSRIDGHATTGESP